MGGRVYPCGFSKRLNNSGLGWLSANMTGARKLRLMDFLNNNSEFWVTAAFRVGGNWVTGDGAYWATYKMLEIEACQLQGRNSNCRKGMPIAGKEGLCSQASPASWAAQLNTSMMKIQVRQERGILLLTGGMGGALGDLLPVKDIYSITSIKNTNKYI